MSAFPKELAKKVAERWDNIVFGSTYQAPPLPPQRLLRSLLEAAYLAAAIPEENRYPKFNIVAVPAEGSKALRLGKVWSFENHRPLSVDEIRRLAPSVDFKKSAILAKWDNAQWHMAGLVDLGTSWGRARIGLQYNYEHAEALLIQVDRPGRMKVYQGEFLVAALTDGKLHRFDGIDMHLALHEPVHRGLEGLGDRIRPPSIESPRDYHSFVFTAHWNTFAAIANCINDEAHGGALVLVPPGSAISADNVRTKYQQDSPVLRDAFIKFMNVRNRVIDFVIRIECGKVPKYVKGDWAHAELELAKAHGDLVEAIRFVARLSGSDGAILLSEDLCLLGFGAEIRAELMHQAQIVEITHELQNSSRPMDIEQFGLRHRSAIKLVSKQPEYTAIVVSQDGPISVVWSREGRVNVRKGVQLTNLNMPWA